MWSGNGSSKYDLNKGHSGRPKHAPSQENIANLNEVIQENLSGGVRKLAAEGGISRESARLILEIHSRLKPQKL